MRGMDDPGPQYVPQLDGDELSALIEVMYLVGFADGVFGEREKTHFQGALQALSDGRADETVLEVAVKAVADATLEHGLDGYISQLNQRLASPQLREIALILASDVAAIDGVLHPKEGQLLRQLAAGFALPELAVGEVLDGFAAPPSA